MYEVARLLQYLDVFSCRMDFNETLNNMVSYMLDNMVICYSVENEVLYYCDFWLIFVFYVALCYLVLSQSF